MKDILAAALFFVTLFVVVFTTSDSPASKDKQDDHAVVPVEPIEPVKTAIIEIQTADWCGPCRKMKASGAIKELEKSGWTIVYRDDLGKSFPTFRVWVKGDSRTFSGFSTKSRLFAKIRQVMKEMKETP